MLRGDGFLCNTDHTSWSTSSCLYSTYCKMSKRVFSADETTCLARIRLAFTIIYYLCTIYYAQRDLENYIIILLWTNCRYSRFAKMELL